MNAGKKCKNCQSEMNEEEWGMGQKTAKKKKQIEKYKNHSTEIPWLRYL